MNTPAFGKDQDQMGKLASLHSVLYFGTGVNMNTAKEDLHPFSKDGL